MDWLHELLTLPFVLPPFVCLGFCLLQITGATGKTPKKKGPQPDVAGASSGNQPQQVLPLNPSHGSDSTDGEPSITTTMAPPATSATEKMVVDFDGARHEAVPMMEDHDKVSDDGLSFTFIPSGATKAMNIHVPNAFKKDRAISP